MKITKAQLTQIIKEEIGERLPVPDPLSPHSVIDQIDELIQQAKMNKSFGFNPKVTESYFQKIRDLLDRDVRMGVDIDALRREVPTLPSGVDIDE
tara:strand:- start:96 stop:380 length:285 start_codon:yes stop_codon:yes gene_type:complete